MNTKKFYLSILTVLLIANFAFAAPSLYIGKLIQPAVVPDPSWTGPQHDPHATQGQWFLNMDGTEEYRTHEFYDNVYNEDVLDSGGGFAGSFAITGYSSNIRFDASNGNIIGFDVIATIKNDTPGEGEWVPGINSHGEQLTNDIDQYRGTLYDTKLAVEFAVDFPSFDAWYKNATNSGAVITDPYTMVDPLIIAENIDELGWYCWTPDNPEQLNPTGAYLVPTYDFGDIPVGKSQTRVLSFSVTGMGIYEEDPLYGVITSDADLFLNRTTSLKISNWIESVLVDNGNPYPYDEYGAPLNSDVSVFHNVPEPSTLVLLTIALGMGMVLGSRRKK
ncbi:MAG: PEP-CTERM sorting domain-containing protein [Planctomycetia bacterium]|jgi:hypothetical protein